MELNLDILYIIFALHTKADRERKKKKKTEEQESLHGETAIILGFYNPIICSPAPLSFSFSFFLTQKTCSSCC